MSESTRVVSPEAILSYPNLFVPKAMAEGQTPKYSAELIFRETADLAAMKAAATAAAVAKWGDKIPKNMRSPFRDGDEREGKPEYEGRTFVGARSTQPPTVFVGPDREVLTDPEGIWAGCVVRASLAAFGYDVNGNKGVSFFLNGIWMLRIGDRIGGHDARSDFDSCEVDAESFGSEETPF